VVKSSSVLKICCVSKYATPPIYGAGSRLFHLASNFQKCGHQTTLITSDANHLSSFPNTAKTYNYEKILDTKVCWIKTKKYKRTASLSRVLSWLDFEIKLFFMPTRFFAKPDVLIVSSLSLLSIIYGYYLKLRFGCKLIFEIRDIWPLTMTEEGGFSKSHPFVVLMGIIERFGYRKSDLVVGTMPRLDNHINEVLGVERPFFCSPLGFENTKPPPTAKDRKNLLHSYFPKGKIIIGYCGSMGISNALETFVQCIKNLEHHSEVHFVLVGEGDLKQKFMEELNLNNNVTFVPRIPSSEVPHFLHLCDILYLSTHDSKVWKFGQSMNKFVEYMLAGKPILATYSGFPSMLNESRAGEFVQPNDGGLLEAAILKYTLMSSSERESIGTRGRRWILENRSYGQLAKEYLQQIEKLVVQVN
jgi:glycosyltransferase involved in cell wall biosynthesis